MWWFLKPEKLTELLGYIHADEEIKAMKLVEDISKTKSQSETANYGVMIGCCMGYLDIVEFMVRMGGDINCQNGHCICRRQSSLMIATRLNFLNIVEFIVAMNPSDYKYQRLNYRHTLLTWACEKNHVLLAWTLINNGANVNNVDGQCNTPLIHACINNQLSLLITLLEHGANPHHKDGYGRTPFMMAIVHNSLDCANFLLSYHEDLKDPTYDYDCNNRSTLCCICRNSNLSPEESLESIRYLLNLIPSGKRLDYVRQVDFIGYNALMWVFETARGHLNLIDSLVASPVVEFLVNIGGDIVPSDDFMLRNPLVTYSLLRWLRKKNFLLFLHQYGFRLKGEGLADCTLRSQREDVVNSFNAVHRVYNISDLHRVIASYL